MKILLRIVGGLVAVVVLAALVVFVAGRFSDGPMGFFSGGAFESGVVVAPPASWDFATDADVIQMQLLEPARSRTVWVVVDEGAAYIPCGIPNFTLWKKWPHEALADGRAEIRLEGKRYPVTLVKSEGRELFERLLKKVGEKYDALPGTPEEVGEVEEDSVWFFRLDPRPTA